MKSSEIFKVIKPAGGSNKTILMIAGWESSLSMMKLLIDNFGKTYNLIATKSFDNMKIDQKVQGNKIPSIHKIAAQTIVDYLRNNIEFQNITIFSHSSLASLVSFELISLLPDHFRSLIIMNGSDHFIENDIQRIFWNQIPLNLRQNASEWIYDETKFGEIFDRGVSHLMKNPLIQNILSELNTKQSKALIEEEIFKIIQRKPFPQKSIPLLIIGGELDEHVPRGFLKEIHKDIQRSELKLVAAANFDGPKHLGKEYFSLIKKFFQKHKL